MKHYEFKVSVNVSDDISTDVLDSIISDVESEKKQLKITQAINLETKSVHKWVMEDFCEELNLKLNKIGLGHFGDIRQDLAHTTNSYSNTFARLTTGINNRGVILKLKGEEDRSFKDSKYTTYTGKYRLYVTYNNGYISYKANQNNDTSTLVETTDDVIRYMESSIKEFLHKRSK